MTVARVADLAKALGFKRDHDRSARDAGVFVRRTLWETSFLYQYEELKRREWRLSIYRYNKENLDVPSERVEIIKTEEDVLTALCKWYMEYGRADVKQRALNIARQAIESINNIHD